MHAYRIRLPLGGYVYPIAVATRGRIPPCPLMGPRYHFDVGFNEVYNTASITWKHFKSIEIGLEAAALLLKSELEPGMAQQRDESHWEVEELGIKMVLISTRALYMCRTTMPEKSFDKVMSFTKIMVEKTEAKRDVRQVIRLPPSPSL